MLHHVELYVSDLERAIRFWTPLMELLGFEPERWSGGINYFKGPNDTYLSMLAADAEHLGAGYHRKRVGLNHLAFRAELREQVDRVVAWAQEAGHPLLYHERFPFATAPDYYAAFVEDPDRIKVEVVAPNS